MRSSKRRKVIGGYITIFISLLLGVFISIFQVFWIGIRQHTFDAEMQLVTDIAGQSVLSEYNRELFERYDLLFTDISFCTSDASLKKVEQHIENYANKNISENGFLNSKLANVDIQSYKLASDCGGEELIKQILDYMGYSKGISILEHSSFMQDMNQYNFSILPVIEDTVKDRILFDKKLKQYPPPKKTTKKEVYDEETGETVTVDVEEEVPIENPMKIANEYRAIGIWNIVIPKESQVSEKEINLSDYISHRDVRLTGTKEANGISDGGKLLNVISKVVVANYIGDKFGNYTAKIAGTPLDYEMEYLLNGNSSDVANLKETINKILLIRETANYLFLKNNTKRNSEIKALTNTVAAVALSPTLGPILEKTIMFGWAFMESIQDIKLLLEGERIPLLKTDSDWITDLERLITRKDAKTQRNTSKVGLSYEEYLKGLIIFEAESKLTYRMMDLIEMNIRKTPYNEFFRMDVCMSEFALKLQFENRNGDCCEAYEEFNYE